MCPSTLCPPCVPLCFGRLWSVGLSVSQNLQNFQLLQTTTSASNVLYYNTPLMYCTTHLEDTSGILHFLSGSEAYERLDLTDRSPVSPPPSPLGEQMITVMDCADPTTTIFDLPYKLSFTSAAASPAGAGEVRNRGLQMGQGTSDQVRREL
eukprot:1190395-Prorocentrum_minimum.AAC.7